MIARRITVILCCIHQGLTSSPADRVRSTVVNGSMSLELKVDKLLKQSQDFIIARQAGPKRLRALVSRRRQVGLCNSEACDCAQDLMFCSCQHPDQQIILDKDKVGSLGEVSTIQISGCRLVRLDDIKEKLPTLRTIIVLNTTRVELMPGSVAFPSSDVVDRMLFLGRIHSLDIQQGALGAGLTSLYIVSTAIQTVQDKTFTGLVDVEVVDLENVGFPQFNSKKTQKTNFDIFPQVKSMKLLKIVDSDLGTIYGRFIKCFVSNLLIQNTKMSLITEMALDIEGKEIILRNNIIDGQTARSIKLVTHTRLLLENNKIEDNFSNIFSLVFPEERVEEVVIRDCVIFRAVSNFLNLHTRHFEVSNTILHLVEENMFKVETGIFIFRENEIKSIETNAISVSASEQIEISNNKFEHIQPGSLEQLKLVATGFSEAGSSSPAFTLINNTFEGMENGFLRLDESIVNNEENVFEGIYFNTHCICDLVSSALEIRSLPLQEPGGSALEVNPSMKETLASLHSSLEDKVKCNEGGHVIYMYESTSCVDWTAIISIAIVTTLSLIVIAVVLFWMNDKLKERALKQFIVPTTSPKEGQFVLQRAESFKSSLPDLIRTMSIERD